MKALPEIPASTDSAGCGLGLSCSLQVALSDSRHTFVVGGSPSVVRLFLASSATKLSWEGIASVVSCKQYLKGDDVQRNTKILLAIAGVALAGGGLDSAASYYLPAPSPAPPPTADTQADYQRTIKSMKPPKRARPVIVILGDNRGSEAMDFLIPFSVLRRSNVADVFAVAMEAAPLKLRPALTIEADMTVADLDVRYPEGADYVVVPAMFDPDTPEVIDWIKRQAKKGATIVGVCAGGQILARAGLLKGRFATTHWAGVREMLEVDPSVKWVPNRRYVADRGVITSTGISAAIPMSLAMVEAIAGPGRAAEVARDLGFNKWGRSHNTSAYSFQGLKLTFAKNTALGWKADEIGIPVEIGEDELTLALTADAWSRTLRSQVLTVAKSDRVRTKGGLELLVDRYSRTGISKMLPPVRMPAGQVLQHSLGEISRFYDEETARLAAMQLEYSVD